MPDAKSRSPKFPSISLPEAIFALRPVFEAESRNKMSRQVLASHLGYSGLSGAATSKIGALRHFGLIEGRGDELRVSQNGVILLMREDDQSEFQSAAREAFLSPTIYSELFNTYDSLPSVQNVEFELVRLGVLKKNVRDASTDFIDSGRFAKAWEENTPETFSQAGDFGEEGARDPDKLEDADGSKTVFGTDALPESAQPEIRPGFSEMSGGLLAKDTEYRLLVKGPFGPNELRRLIRKIEIDIEILLEEG